MKFRNYLKLVVGLLKPITDIPDSFSLSGAQGRNIIRASYRIASIDDEDFLHKARLRELGFQVDYYSKLSEVNPATHYGIYICDIMGIENDTAEDGVWTMQEIRLRAPIAPIIGYTRLGYADAKYQSARQICDTLLRKSDEIDEIAAALDSHILEINDPKTLWIRVRRYLNNKKVQTRHIAVLEHYYVKAILNKDPDSFGINAQAYLSSGGLDNLIADAVPLVAKSVGTTVIKSAIGLPSS